MQRIFAHDIVFNGHHYPAHVLEYDERTGRTSIYPFTTEIHSTRFFSGTVEARIEQGRIVTSRPSAHVVTSKLNP